MTDWDNIYSTNDTVPFGKNIPELWDQEIKLLDPHLKSNPNQRILDYGFGTGDMIDHMKTYGHKVYGAEESIVAIDKYLGVANKNYAKKLLARFFSQRLAHTNHPDTLTGWPKFDLITCIGVLHHTEPLLQISFLDGFREIMKRDGKLIIAGWDINDNFIREKSTRTNKSKMTEKNVYPVNSLERKMDYTGLKIVDTDTISFYDDIKYKMDRLLRFYTIESNR